MYGAIKTAVIKQTVRTGYSPSIMQRFSL